MTDILGGLSHSQNLPAERALNGDALNSCMAELAAWANVGPMPNCKRVPAFGPFRYRNANLVE